MNDMERVTLRLPPEEPDQARRLAAFRAAHPHVIIGSIGFGTWQARIPENHGETITTRYTLRELLDKLDELLGGEDGLQDQGGQSPRRTPGSA